MELCRCPVCHARVDLHACVQDEDGRALLALLARTPTALAKALVQYLTLFRAPTRDLSNSRAKRLAEDALAIHSDPYNLAAAMLDTVEGVQAKRAAGDGAPLKNHNYLKSVLKTVSERTGNTASVVPTGTPKRDQLPVRDSDEAWRAQMKKLGHDPDKLISKVGIK
jgi:hypothetical protein